MKKILAFALLSFPAIGQNFTCSGASTTSPFALTCKAGTASITFSCTLTASGSYALKCTAPLTPVTPPPVNPPPPPPPQGPPVTSTVTACGDITQPGVYTLANDVSSAGTCFGIDAAGITLNLNGHTITYGTGGGSTPMPAIESHACTYTTGHYAGGYCGKQGGGLEVYGGKIVQSTNSAPFSDVFSFGQGNFTSAPYIHDVTATFQNQGAQFYYSTYLPAGAKIENNIIHDNVTNIQEPGQGMLSARSAFQGQAIMIMNTSNKPGVGDIIAWNTIIGSPQGGIRSDNQNTSINENDISMNARYSNDFCADMPAAGQVAQGNNCHPISGRGFHLNAANDVVKNNTIAVTELKQNAEYNGCESGGAYAVQVEFDAFQGVPPTGGAVTGNVITATAGNCDAIGFRVTSTTSAGNAEITGNTVTTSNSGAAGRDYGISLDAANGAGITITGNIFSSRYAYVGGGWDGYQAFSIGANTWLGTPLYTVDSEDGGCGAGVKDTLAVCPVNIQFIDALPNKVKCYGGSVAKVTIAGKVTACP